jgi:hypothetical protein
VRRAFTWLPWVLLILVIISFLSWQKLHQPKPTVAADGVKMPTEKKSNELKKNGKKLF